MDSALSPREIQTRIRAGESLRQVAEAAGVPEERIEAFAGPVLAERDHMASMAKTSLLRRRGDSQNHRTLLAVLTEKLQARRLDVDQLDWDAYRLPDRTWRVVTTLTIGDLVREGWFTYDPRGRHTTTDNADARWMVAEESPAGAGADEESTVDLNDELALVRATSEGRGEPELDDYVPAEFAEVDGLYDIVGPKHSEMDVLYDMLSGISEDSVRIYEGLGEVVVEEAPPIDEPEPEADPGPVDEEPAAPAAPEPEQDALIEEPETPKPAPKRRGRASVPAWDDILFGGPKNPPKNPRK